jgi:hypothetical protein
MSEETRAKAREYLKARGTLQPAAVVRERVASAFEAFDRLVAPLPSATAARASIPGEWSVQEIVDHLVETHRPGLDELRCLLAGRRPQGEPIPASLQSKAPLLRPWQGLLDELRRVHGSIVAALEAVPADFHTDATAPLVMVINVTDAEGRVRALEWVEELDWKAYAITWRLHAIDHLNQVKKVLARCG